MSALGQSEPADRRVCFTLRVRPERIEEYRARHAAVWAEMLAALREAGSRNYSIILRDDGTLVGDLQCDDFAAAQAAMRETDINSRWQAEMHPSSEIRGRYGSRRGDGAVARDLPSGLTTSIRC